MIEIDGKTRKSLLDNKIDMKILMLSLLNRKFDLWVIDFFTYFISSDMLYYTHY